MRVVGFVALAAAWILPAGALAGTTGSLSGTVFDAGMGAPIAGASVVVEDPTQREQTVSDSSGHFIFVSLAPGTYTIAVNKAGFTSSSSTVYIAADVSERLSLQLLKGLRRIEVTSATASGALVSGRSPVVRARLAHVMVDGYTNTLAWVRQGTTADVYVLPSEFPFYSFDGSDIYALHFVPGLSFGAGPVLAR